METVRCNFEFADVLFEAINSEPPWRFESTNSGPSLGASGDLLHLGHSVSTIDRGWLSSLLIGTTMTGQPQEKRKVKRRRPEINSPRRQPVSFSTLGQLMLDYEVGEDPQRLLKFACRTLTVPV
jgi:hypothetical protein